MTLLSGGPFVSAASRVIEVDPASGKVSQFINLLASAIDVIQRVKGDNSTQFLVLEYSLALTKGQPGRLLFYDTAVGQIMTDNLPSPTAMAFDATTSSLYVTSRGNGTVLLINLPK